MNMPEGFKVKGKSWAGNIYHQFESICQDVDDFMSKETVKFVENQVQSVGMNMKKLYSDVVQDILPPSEEPVGPKAQAKDCKIVENSQLSLNQDSAKSSRDCFEPLPLEEVPFEEAKTDQSPSEDSIKSSQNWCEPWPLEEGPFREPKTDQSPSDNSLQEEITSGKLMINKGERASFDLQKNWDEFSDDQESVSNMSNSGWLFDNELTFFEDPKSDENTSLSTGAVSLDDKVNGDNGLSLNPQSPSPGDGISNKDENSPRRKAVPSLEVVVSYFSCDENEDDDDQEEEKQAQEQKDEKAEETNVISCTCSTSPKPSSLLESQNTAYETKAVDLPRAFSIFESNGLSATASTLSGNKAIIPFETGNTNKSFAGINDLNLETVDLSPDVKHEDERVDLNCEFDRAASHRKDFRYYKKLIKDTFTSRKRLSKEYEHIAILYGDIDTESREHFRPSTVPSSPNKYIYQDISDSEWELI